MKIKGKKYISILCTLVLLALSITACQNNNSTDTSPTPAQEENMKSTPTPTQAPTATPTIAPTPAETPAPTTAAPVSTIKNTEPFTLTWIGHASVKLKSKSGKVIYIDPNFAQGDYSEKADFILITHAHDDHQPCEAVVPNDNCVTIKFGDAYDNGTYKSFDYGDIQIEAVPAGGNGNHAIGSGCGWLVTVDGVKVYHAGDTSMIDEMKELTKREIDFAMYPIDWLYNMGPKEATEVANLVAAKVNIPIHDMNGFNEHKEDKFTPEGKLVLAKGETIYLGENK